MQSTVIIPNNILDMINQPENNIKQQHMNCKITTSKSLRGLIFFPMSNTGAIKFLCVPQLLNLY